MLSCAVMFCVIVGRCFLSLCTGMFCNIMCRHVLCYCLRVCFFAVVCRRVFCVIMCRYVLCCHACLYLGCEGLFNSYNVITVMVVIVMTMKTQFKVFCNLLT